MADKQHCPQGFQDLQPILAKPWEASQVYILRKQECYAQFSKKFLKRSFPLLKPIPAGVSLQASTCTYTNWRVHTLALLHNNQGTYSGTSLQCQHPHSRT